MAKKQKTVAAPAPETTTEQTAPEVTTAVTDTAVADATAAVVDTVVTAEAEVQSDQPVADATAETQVQGDQPVEGVAEEQTAGQTAEVVEGNDQFLDSAATQETATAEETQPVQEVAAIDIAEVKAVIEAEVEEVIQAQPLTPDQVQLKTFKQQLEAYEKDFAPGVPHMDAARSANAQLRLVRLLKDAPVQLGACFEEGYNFALNLIATNAKNRGAFHDDYIFRFYDQPRIRNNPEDRDNALFLVSFLKSVANPQTRSIVLKQVDIPRILKIYDSEEAIRKIQNFFNIR